MVPTKHSNSSSTRIVAAESLLLLTHHRRRSRSCSYHHHTIATPNKTGCSTNASNKFSRIKSAVTLIILKVIDPRLDQIAVWRRAMSVQIWARAAWISICRLNLWSCVSYGLVHAVKDRTKMQFGRTDHAYRNRLPSPPPCRDHVVLPFCCVEVMPSYN